MAAGLSLSRAKVTIGDDVLDRVSVIIRQNVATVRLGRDVVREVDGVVSVERSNGSRTAWVVSFADGSTWNIVKAKGCGCGS